MDQKTKIDPPVTEKVEEEEVERIIRDTPKNGTEPKKVNVTFITVRFQHIAFSPRKRLRGKASSSILIIRMKTIA